MDWSFFYRVPNVKYKITTKRILLFETMPTEIKKLFNHIDAQKMVKHEPSFKTNRLCIQIEKSVGDLISFKHFNKATK